LLRRFARLSDRPRDVIRFRIEALLAALSAGLCTLTLLRRDWLEAIFGLDPDAHSGSLEWAIVLALLSLAIAFGVLAGLELRRPGPAVPDSG
jgi:hypothetical protein